MNIVVRYDATVASAPAGFKVAVQAAVDFIDNLIIDPITVPIVFSYGAIDGTPLGKNALGESETNGNVETYSSLVSLLTAAATSQADKESVAALPATDPTNGGSFWVSDALAKVFGLGSELGYTDPEDGFVGLTSQYKLSYDPNNRSAPGEYDAIGVLEHEITEVLGRIDYQGTSTLSGKALYAPLDLFHYSGPGVHTVAATGGYFSVDGQTMLLPFNDPSNGGDGGDWASSVVGDSFGDGSAGIAGTVSLTDIQVMDVLGFTITPLLGGGQQVDLASSSSNTASLFYSQGNWDAVTGSNGAVNLYTAQASVFGGGDRISLDGSSSNAVSLYNTAGAWDTVTGGNGSVNLNASQASVLGGNDWVYFSGSAGNEVSLYDTAGNWDTVAGSNGGVTVNASQVSVLGGNDRLYFDGSASDAVSLYNTKGNWDTVTGSNGGVSLYAAQASVFGGGDRLYLDGSSSDAVSLYSTGGNWDTVTGSNGSVNVSAAQVSVLGGHDWIYLDGSSSDAVSLYNTQGNWDTVAGSNGLVILNGVQATVIGSNDTINLATGSTLTANGQNEILAFQRPAFGNTWITGFNSSDVLTFATSDWGSFSAMQAAGAITQSGANTIIRLDAADSVTLYNVAASSLTASQFSFK